MSAVVETFPARAASPVVHKFGGSSVETPQAIRRCIAILAEESAARAYVVVSAARGVTDALLQLVADAAGGRDWRQQLARQLQRQRRMIRALVARDAAMELESALARDARRLRKLLGACAVLRLATPDASDEIAAHGELWSMRLFAAALPKSAPAEALDARRFLRASREAGGIRVDWRESERLFHALAAASGARFVVLPGFIAGCAFSGNTLTLGRNGSDWSATIVARLAGAHAVTIWTDVDGVLDADPRCVPAARPQATVGRGLAAALAEHGARVLHPSTLAPLADRNVEVRVRSTFMPAAAGTMIDNDSAPPGTVITARTDAAGSSVSAIGAHADAAGAILALRRVQLAPVTVHAGTEGVHFTVREGDAVRAQRVLHRALCLRKPALSLAVLGSGNVGRALLRLLASRDDMQLLAVANSQRMLLDADGLDPARVVRRLQGARAASDAVQLAQFLLGHAESAPVIVDATASEATARLHADWLAAGIHVVTANKLAAAEGWIDGHRDDIFYGDAATVGAGLPLLAAIRRLRASGDRMLRIDATLSGSLAWIFHALQEGRPFSRSVLAARRAGLTEPDARIDLGGVDVARKLAILAQAAGIHPLVTPQPETLLDEAVLSSPLAQFPARLAAMDAHWRDRAREARRHGTVLRYVASLDAGGRTHIGVRAVAADNPLAQTRGVDNCAVIASEAHHREPLVIRGAGAGAAITAHALLADLAEVRTRFG